MIKCEACRNKFDKLCFRDMKIMSRRNGGDSVINETAGSYLFVYYSV